jgi:nucleotide-binding universal stress UspA family protein
MGNPLSFGYDGPTMRDRASAGSFFSPNEIKEHVVIPFRTVLVAADLSESSRQAFRFACSLACNERTHIFVYHILEPSYATTEPVVFGQQTVGFDPIAREPQFYESLKTRLREFYVPDRSLDVEYETSQEGNTAAAILCRARELGCDLIVLGTHGRTGLDRVLTGSVAETVLRKAECAVLASRGSRLLRENEPIRVIVHPTDFSECSEPALQVARRLAHDHKARLVILHVAPPEIIIDGTPAVAIDPLVYRIPLEEVCERVDGRDLKCRPDPWLGRGDPAAEILRRTRELQGDLIVLGTHGRSGLGRLLMGSVAESVLRGADCPVLTVRAPLTPSVPAPASEHATVG